MIRFPAHAKILQVGSTNTRCFIGQRTREQSLEKMAVSLQGWDVSKQLRVHLSVDKDDPELSFVQGCWVEKGK